MSDSDTLYQVIYLQLLDKYKREGLNIIDASIKATDEARELIEEEE